MSNKVAIVTGGSRGIGKSCALELAKAGYDIAFNGTREESQVSAVIDEIKACGVNVLYQQANVADAEQAEAFINKVKAELGRIDVLVNNAGITKDNLFIRMSAEDWQKVLDINLTGVFNVTKPAAKIMMKQRSGAIVNMSSISGVMGNPGQANYSASKAGLIGFTKSLAKELSARGIRVNAVAPGFIATDMTEELNKEQLEAMIPLKRFGKPEEIANAVVFLADKADYITGQVINVDGGLVM